MASKSYKAARRENYKKAQILKYLQCLSFEEREELNNKLDEIDTITNPEEKEKKEKELQGWLALKYVQYNIPICLMCAKADICKRNKTVVKTCKIFERKEEKEDVELVTND